MQAKDKMNRIIFKIKLPFFIFFLVACGLIMTHNVLGATISAEAPVTVTTINIAIASASAGDVVIIPNGTYDLNYNGNTSSIVEFNVSGVEGNEIIFRAETPGGVTFNGEFRADINGSYWIIKDFVFKDIRSYDPTNIVVRILNTHGDYIRITNNHFKDCGEVGDKTTGGLIWGLNDSDYVEVDHNTFENWPEMEALSPHACYHWHIHHNYFTCPDECGDHDSVMQIGGDGTWVVDQDLHAIFENNLIYKVKGDGETITNKSSSNIYRYNVFKESNSMNIRNGDDVTITWNYFFNLSTPKYSGGTEWPGASVAAVGINGDNNTVSYNYIENSDIGIILRTADNPDYVYHTYDQVSDADVHNNIIINLDNARYGLYVGGFGFEYPMINSDLYNNIVDMNQSGSYLYRVADIGTGNTFSGNTCNNYGTATYEFGSTGFCNTKITTSFLSDVIVNGYNLKEPSSGYFNAHPPVSDTDVGHDFLNNVTDIRADVDQQNGINSTDAMLTLRNSLSLDMSQTAWQESATTGDVNCDGTSNSTDAMLILRHSVGLSMSGTGWCE